MDKLTPRERFITALERKPLTGLVPHFELVFYLTMEAFGAVHHLHRRFDQWDQMSRREQELQLLSIADMYIQTAERYSHSAIFVHGELPYVALIAEKIRELSGERYFLCTHGDATFAIPDGNGMYDFSYRLVDEPEKVLEEAERRVQNQLEWVERLFIKNHLIDGIALCSDYCLNTGPFLSPGQFSEFIAPFLKKLIRGYRDMGLYTIKHTDGNIMPIIDQLVQCAPHALHSLDPQAGVSLAEVVRLYGDKVALCGNVNCGLLQTGTDEQCTADVRRSLRDGMRAPGYIFCTSNCIYTGMPLERYDRMLDIWRTEGSYGEQ